MNNNINQSLTEFIKDAQKTKAYRSFLKDNFVSDKSISRQEDFKSLPTMDKKNYINKYPLNFFCPNGKMPPMMHSSSGSSGKPTFWFMGDEQEELGAKIHELIFEKIFGIKKNEPTLVVDCFAMGSWIAGTYTLNACRRAARRGYALTIVTPGIEKENVLNILKSIAANFKNLILIGYPPFIMDLLIEVSKAKIRLGKEKILTAGENFEENFRKKALKLAGLKDYYSSLINVYGSADTAILGHETPLTIFLRTQSILNKNLYRELFGQERLLPSLVQYNPENIYAEEINGELIITAKAAIPLIRYNIHDKGRVLSYEAVKDILKKLGLYEKARKYGLNQWRLPFIVINGRTDVAATIYGLNIYPENIRSGLADKRISKFFSGNFLVYKENKAKNQKLRVKLELAKNLKLGKKDLKLARKIIIENLLKLNAEFRKLYSSISGKALVLISAVPSGHKIFKEQKTKGLWQIKGKKPKIKL